MNKRRLLIVAYQFPPVGGAGVQRIVKFCKYLPQYGWEPTVLTVSNPSVPLMDRSLLKEVADDTLICRARTLEPGYATKSLVSANTNGSSRSWVRRAVRRSATLLLQPDPQILWWPDAIRQGRRLLEQLPHEAILVTAPPFSAFGVGWALARRFHLPLVLDYRDEWTLSSAYWENKRLDPVSRLLQDQMQRHLLRRADGVIATTQASAESLRRICRQVRSKAQVQCIYNGYDAEDIGLPPTSPPFPESTYRLSYIGTLWNLTSLRPLVSAVAELDRRRPDLSVRLELVFAGRRTEAQQELVDVLKIFSCRVVEHPYLDHTQALQVMRNSDGLLVLLSDLPGMERVVPAKLFESLAARKTVVSIAPRGEVWDLLEPYPSACRLLPSDIESIVQCLIRLIECRPSAPVDLDVRRYERRHLTGQLAEMLGRIVSPVGAGG